ncbi:hypothetical protein Lal_00037642 [Lupinus albus]|nr:hypothetical protein Lal_00037642 [Lupinus albus]
MYLTVNKKFEKLSSYLKLGIIHDTQHVLLKSTQPFSFTHNSQFPNYMHLLHLLNTQTPLNPIFLFVASPLLKYKSDVPKDFVIIVMRNFMVGINTKQK